MSASASHSVPPYGPPNGHGVSHVPLPLPQPHSVSRSSGTSAGDSRAIADVVDTRKSWSAAFLFRQAEAVVAASRKVSTTGASDIVMALASYIAGSLQQVGLPIVAPSDLALAPAFHVYTDWYNWSTNSVGVVPFPISGAMASIYISRITPEARRECIHHLERYRLASYPFFLNTPYFQPPDWTLEKQAAWNLFIEEAKWPLMHWAAIRELTGQPIIPPSHLPATHSPLSSEAIQALRKAPPPPAVPVPPQIPPAPQPGAQSAAPALSAKAAGKRRAVEPDLGPGPRTEQLAVPPAGVKKRSRKAYKTPQTIARREDKEFIDAAHELSEVMMELIKTIKSVREQEAQVASRQNGDVEMADGSAEADASDSVRSIELSLIEERERQRQRKIARKEQQAAKARRIQEDRGRASLKATQAVQAVQAAARQGGAPTPPGGHSSAAKISKGFFDPRSSSADGSPQPPHSISPSSSTARISPDVPRHAAPASSGAVLPSSRRSQLPPTGPFSAPKSLDYHEALRQYEQLERNRQSNSPGSAVPPPSKALATTSAAPPPLPPTSTIPTSAGSADSSGGDVVKSPIVEATRSPTQSSPPAPAMRSSRRFSGVQGPFSLPPPSLGSFSTSSAPDRRKTIATSSSSSSPSVPSAVAATHKTGSDGQVGHSSFRRSLPSSSYPFGSSAAPPPPPTGRSKVSPQAGFSISIVQRAPKAVKGLNGVESSGSIALSSGDGLSSSSSAKLPDKVNGIGEVSKQQGKAPEVKDKAKAPIEVLFLDTDSDEEIRQSTLPEQ